MRSILLALCLLVWTAPGPVTAGVRIVDGDTLAIDGVKYRINGIDAPEAGQTCQRANGRDWRCGKAATDRLFALTDGRDIRCDALARDGYGRVVARCFADGRDLAAAMVREGLAWAFRKFSDEYAGQEARARRAGIGIWQGAATPAWEFRQARWTKATQGAPAGCPIKGNISKSGRIYHTPWSPWYTRTRISTAKGERWFCSEAEAVAAGWRAPYWH